MDIKEDGYFYGDSGYFLTNESYHSFFIRADGRPAGFVIVGDGGYLHLDDKDAHNIDEFFVMKKYRRNGIGRFAAGVVLDMFKGK